MDRKIWAIVIFIIIISSLSQPGSAAGQVSVFVSIVPQKYFVQQIGKDLVDVQVMVQPEASPATYEPKPRQMADLSKAKVYFAIGVPFENADSRHSEHGILDPHIWLSPPLVKIQDQSILRALQEIDPSNRTTYEANYHQFVSAIDELDGDLRKTSADKQKLQFMVFHPAWGYFAPAMAANSYLSRSKV